MENLGTGLKGTLFAQYADWDLKKTSNTLTETLIGFFLWPKG